ncbi:hypothetical protein C942_02309 [Photobacterium marinum]|uniref:Uncharacterized protein n=1 Tax=Photobacterium marinum TaxID=1056511 RepID=L8J989_9GAMM|nr:hypothetical protein [Photobacterium marinum]ELR64738.1 hypothetical protein C942_02309 [Photobacterium marinum]
MELLLSGDMDIEVDGESVQLSACGNEITLTLTQISTLALAARSIARMPRFIDHQASLSLLTTLCPVIRINVGTDTVLEIRRRKGIFSRVWIHHYSLQQKWMWLKNSFRLLRRYYR